MAAPAEIATQIPYGSGDHAFRATGEAIVGRFDVGKAEAFDRELLCVVPIEFRFGGLGCGVLGKQRRAAECDEKIAAVHIAASLSNNASGIEPGLDWCFADLRWEEEAGPPPTRLRL